MVGKNWGRYVRQYIYVVLTRMGANGEGVSSLLGCAKVVHIGQVYINDLIGH